MEIEVLGHAAVIVESDGFRLLIDPYESGQFDGRMAYAPITDRVDRVLCTHAHLDHSATHVLRGAPERVDEGTVGPFRIERVSLAHDEYGGRRRGGLVDAVVIDDGADRLVHLSDVGQSPEPDRIDALRSPDVLLVPVGGFYTIGAAQAWEWTIRLRPRITIPIHYRTTACHLPIRPIENFLCWAGSFSVADSCRLSTESGVGGVVAVPPKYA